MGEGGSSAVPLWDLPTRLTHWAIAIAFGVSWYTADNHLMGAHRISGYVILGLVVFRLYWGVAGGSTARFASFVRGPGVTMAYARTLPQRDSAAVAGHNPLGAWSVVAMIALLFAQVAMGLFAVDVDGFESGPLSHWVSFETGRTIAGAHEWGFRGLLVLISLHLIAVAYYHLYKRQNLIGAMIHGRRRLGEGAEPLKGAPLWRLALGVAIAAGLAWAIAKGLRF